MKTTELIDSLAEDLRPTPRSAAAQRFAIALVAGGCVALVAVLTYFGGRNDLAIALLTLPFWMKWAFALAMTAAALTLSARLARPSGTPGVLPILLAAPVVVLGAVALIELGVTPAAERLDLWLGKSATHCPWNIAALAIPIFIGVFWAMRRLAPTRLRFAGFSAGCLAGAAAALIYAVHCDETAASFVVTWYTAGIMVPAAVGFLIGPRVLRW
jgi:hypothetical protein